jgi:hypothetical protein
MKNDIANITVKLDLVLFIIFLMLKLDGIIQWKWIWIFSPFWILWTIEISLAIFIAFPHIKLNHTSKYASGSRLVWDAKTNTMYGPNMEE